jgi:hypothetical protein
MLRAAAILLLCSAALAGCAEPRGEGPEGQPSITGTATGGDGTPTTSASLTTTRSDGTGTGASTSTETCGWMSQQDCSECPWHEGCPIPAMDADADVKIEFRNESLEVGGAAEVWIVNEGEAEYRYSAYYLECDMTYHTAGGRQFIVPPGTHCDLANTAVLGPGEEVHVFTWGLDECTQDDWGCSESEPLPEGDYAVRVTLCAPASGSDYGEDCGIARSRSGIDFTIAAAA